MSSICDNMFSDKYNSRANPCNLFEMLQKTWQISCETKLFLIFFRKYYVEVSKGGGDVLVVSQGDITYHDIE